MTKLIIDLGDDKRNEALAQRLAGEDENDGGGITAEGLALGHRYQMGNVNAYCAKCSSEHSEREGRSITVLDCDYDLDT